MTKITNNQQRTLLKTKPNKAKVKIGEMSISIALIKDYDKNTNNQQRMLSKQSQTKPISKTEVSLSGVVKAKTERQKTGV